MSANVASDDPPEIGIVDHTMNNGGPLYPIEVCEATIAVNETQNPESRHQRVKGSFLPLFSPFSLCFPQETWTWIRLWFIFVVTFVVLWRFVVPVLCCGLLFVYWQWGWGWGIEGYVWWFEDEIYSCDRSPVKHDIFELNRFVVAPDCVCFSVLGGVRWRMW